MKRLFDIAASMLGLIATSPILLPVMFLVWLQDRHSPFYVAPRVARGGGTFKMIKLRSMIINADKSGVDSTGANDRRITGVGRFIRRCKLDELPQLWNVLCGDMSLVGPRPNVKRETDLYTPIERGLLEIRPGITDFASIVFADEGDILAPHGDPDLAYNQLIRPWKSRLGLAYVAHSGVFLDVWLIAQTIRSAVDRSGSLAALSRRLAQLNQPSDLVVFALRNAPLEPAAPPGTEHIVQNR